MRRTAASVTAIHQALRSRGLTVTPRRIEGWSAADLLPPPTQPLDRQIDHYAALTEYSGKGIDADVTSFRLAAHGFDCQRLRPALLRHFNITEPVPVPHLELGSSEAADAAFEQIEDLAREVAVEFSRVAPPAFGKIFNALERNAERSAGLVGPSRDEESGESVFHSFLVSSACYFFGGEMYNAKAMAAATNLDFSTVTDADLDFVNSLTRILTRIKSEEIDQAYLTLPTEQIASMANLLREAAPRALGFLELESLNDSELESVCAVVAPMLVYGIEVIREHICEPGLQALAPVLSFMDSERALSA